MMQEPPAQPESDGADSPAAAMAVTVIGAGRVGLATAACLASLGHRVTAIDTNGQKIDRLARTELPPQLQQLAPLLRQQLAAKRLRFTAPSPEALRDAQLVFIAVGTPGRADGSTDLSAVDAVVELLREAVRHPAVVVLRSTVPVGTARAIQAKLAQSCQPGEAPRVLSHPEFLREGRSVDDLMRPDSIVIGADPLAGCPGEVATVNDGSNEDAAVALLRRLYQALADAGVPVLTMDTRSAELSKYAANAMLALRISFINEIADIASATGADIEQVGACIGGDPRIGPHFLRPGLGYGGPCLSKDVAALRETARRHNLRSDILLAAQRVNARQRCWSFEALLRDLGSRDALRGLRVALWGLAFKPGTDDVREAPSLVMLSRLSRAGALVAAYDPAATANARAAVGELPHLVWAGSAAAAVRGADVLLLATEWPEFVVFDPQEVAANLSRATVFDGRNALDAAAWSAAGLRIVQVGRAPPRRSKPDAAADGATDAQAASAPRSTSWIVTA